MPPPDLSPAPPPEAPVVVVGGGMAGMFLATWLVHLQAEVLLLEAPGAPGASQVAAGLLNTVTGRQATRTWHADALLADFESFCALPLAHGTQACVHRLPIYRRLHTPDEYNDWCGRLAHLPNRHGQPGEIRLQDTPWRPDLLGPHPAGLWVHGIGWVDIPAMLHRLRTNLLATGRFHYLPEAALPHTADAAAGTLRTAAGRTCWFSHLVFAEGIAVNANPLRPFRPLQPLHGEILLVQLDLDLDAILTGGTYVLPAGGGRYHVGSTYTPNRTSPQPTPEGQALLLRHLHTALPGYAGPVTVLGHRAGIRATTPDRKAVLGRHPQFPNMWFCNGLGTKGLLQAPFAARHLAAAIQHGQAAWPAELSLERKALQPPLSRS